MNPTKLTFLLLVLSGLNLISTGVLAEDHHGQHGHNHEHHDHPKELVSNHSSASPLVDGIKSIIDLSHPLNNATLHWPTNFGFEHLILKEGEFPNDKNVSHYLMSDGFRTAVHTGTHLDAPRHFSTAGWTVDQIPLERLVDVPVCVIDVSEKVRVNRNYNFHKEDFMDVKTGKSLVAANSVVLVFTNISATYDQGAKAYFGTNTTNISEMSIPGFSEEAAKYLVEQGIFGVGLDAPSADSSLRHGINNTYDPVAHSIFNSHNVYILENIHKNLKQLVGTDAHLRLIITPLAIVGGSGSPVRLVAMTAHDDCPLAALKNAASAINPLSSPMIIMSAGILFVYHAMRGTIGFRF